MKKKLYPLENFNLNFGISNVQLYKLSQNLGAHPRNFRFKLRKFQNSYVRQNFDLEYYSKLQAFITKKLYFFIILNYIFILHLEFSMVVAVQKNDEKSENVIAFLDNYFFTKIYA